MIFKKNRMEVVMQLFKKQQPPFCSCCGKPQTLLRRLEVHHIKPKESFPELACDPSNFLLVCKKCHLYVCHNGNFFKYVENIIEILRSRIIKINEVSPKI